MRMLMLGGTAWLGRRIVEAALHAGHEVTCLARGDGVPAGAVSVVADRDADDALSAVSSVRWDAVVDVARQPGHVRRAVRDLERVTERFVFVSSVNVYADQSGRDDDEDAALLAPLRADVMTSGDQYGAAKVAGETAVLDGFGADRCSVVRAGLIGGPGDASGRTDYWPWRFTHPVDAGTRVIVPDAPDLPTAVIDVKDLADWIVRLAEGPSHGVVNALGHRMPLAEHLAVAREVGGNVADAVALPTEWLLAQGVAEWSGPRSLPLWLADPSWSGLNARSTARAIAAGLQLRPLARTLADSVDASARPSGGGESGAGLGDDDERELLAAWSEMRGAR